MEKSDGGGMWEQREHMFDVVLKPSDIGKQLWIEEENFKRFPTTVLNLSFVDSNGKTWKFVPSSFKGSEFFLSDGWEEFVMHMGLRAGDVVSFWRARVMNEDNDEDVFFVDYEKKHHPLAKGKLCRFEECGIISRDGSDFCDVHSVWSKAGQRDIPSTMVTEKENCKPIAESSLIIIETEDCDGRDMATRHPALLFCTIFPDNYEFEKDTLIQLWLAGGFFMEKLGQREQYFEARQFFTRYQAKDYIQPSKRVLASGIMLYKFNKMKLSMLSPTYSYVMIDNKVNLTNLPADVSHVAVGCCSFMNSAALGRFKNFKQLQSLLFVQGQQSSFRQIPRDLFFSLTQLQALDLSQTHISELPNTIASLKSLRYLDLSQTAIKRLPETIDHLTNLQTLKLMGCSGLSLLPKGMRKLVSLSHLEVDVLRQLHTMPQGLGSLTYLQTLSAFLVGTEDDCGIGQLKNMNNLRGRFCISGLENVSTVEEAMEACLCHKSLLMELELHWSDSRDKDDNEEMILSCLHPNANLRKLRLVSYGGLKLPSWICDPMFSMLVCITFFNFENCVVLPSLGQLPSLKFLNIIDLHKLKVIDLDFNGENVSQGSIAFPKLEKLCIENMYSLEEWIGIENPHYPSLVKLTVKYCPKLHTLSSLSCLCALEDLEISHCPVLAPTPDVKLPDSVLNFIIKDCPIISASILRDDSPEWSKVAHVPSIWIDHQEVSHDRSKQALTGIVDSHFFVSSNTTKAVLKFPLINKPPKSRIPCRTHKVQCSSTDDGYTWRKYGEKVILNAKFPRSYYKCAHKVTRGCLATKLVQKKDDDPPTFDVIYRGKHTCCQQSSTSSSVVEDCEVGVLKRFGHDQPMIPVTMAFADRNLVGHQQQNDEFTFALSSAGTSESVLTNETIEDSSGS